MTVLTRKKEKPFPYPQLIAVLAAALVIRVLLCMTLPGYPEDQGYFIGWIHTLQAYGLGQAYMQNPTINYPPVYVVVLKLYGMLASALDLNLVKGGFAIRVPCLIIDLSILLAVLGGIVKGRPKHPLLGYAFFALNPAFIMGGPVWGQIDLLHSSLMIGALYLPGKRPYASGAVYALALLTKFQSIVIAPVIFVFLLRKAIQTKGWRAVLAYGAGFLTPVILACGYFYTHGALGAMLRAAYVHAVDTYALLSLNAINIWYHAFGTDPWASDTNTMWLGITYKQAGLLLLSAAVLWICCRLLRIKKPSFPVLLKGGAAISFSCYMLATQMHERYSLPTVAMLCLLLLYERKWWIPAAALTITTSLNLVYVLQASMDPSKAVWMVYVNTAVLLWMMLSIKQPHRLASYSPTTLGTSGESYAYGAADAIRASSASSLTRASNVPGASGQRFMNGSP